MGKRNILYLFFWVFVGWKVFSLETKADVTFQGSGKVQNEFKGESFSEGIKLFVSAFEKNISGSGVLWFEGIDFQENSWGAGLSSGKLIPFLNLDIKGGQLVYSEGFSLLNNPSIYSSVSPFSEGNGKVKKVNVKLPDKVYSNKPLSVCLKTKGTSGKLKPLNISAGCLFDSQIPQFFIESGYSFVPAKTSRFELSFLARFFQVEEGNSDSWYKSQPSFHKDYLAALGAQFSFSSSFCSVNFTDALFTSPFGFPKNTYKLDLVFPNLNFSVFFNPNRNLITASGKTMDEMFQAKWNTWFQFKAGKLFPLFWKFGISAFYQNDYRDKTDVLKAAAGTRFLCYLTCVSLVFSVDIGIIPDFESVIPEKYRLNISDVWYFERIQPSVKVTAEYNPGKKSIQDKWNESVSLDFQFCQNPRFSFGATGDFSQSASYVSKSVFSASFSINYQSKIIDVNGKLSLSIE